MFKRTYYVQRAERRDDGAPAMRDTSFSSFICALFIFVLLASLIVVIAQWRMVFLVADEVEIVVPFEDGSRSAKQVSVADTTGATGSSQPAEETPQTARTGEANAHATSSEASGDTSEWFFTLHAREATPDGAFTHSDVTDSYRNSETSEDITETTETAGGATQDATETIAADETTDINTLRAAQPEQLYNERFKVDRTSERNSEVKTSDDTNAATETTTPTEANESSTRYADNFVMSFDINESEDVKIMEMDADF